MERLGFLRMARRMRHTGGGMPVAGLAQRATLSGTPGPTLECGGEVHDTQGVGPLLTVPRHRVESERLILREKAQKLFNCTKRDGSAVS